VLVTDANDVAILYNQTGQFYCQSASNFDCVALYNLEGPIEAWDCASQVSDTCAITILNLECRRIGVYDENDNFLTLMESGTNTFGSSGLHPTIWEDPRPLGGDENRSYIFKENNLVLGRQSVSCARAITQIEVVSNYFSGCTDVLDRFELRNTGCRTIEVHNSNSDVVSTHAPGETFFASTGVIISILIAGSDTLSINADDRNDLQVDSGGCEADGESTCGVTITNTQCRGIGVYDENDNFLTSMAPGPHPFGPTGQAPSIWEDPQPLGVDEERVYIFKENNLILGRETVSCANAQINVVSKYFSGCTDAIGIAELTNTGCRTITVHNTRSEVLSTHEPGEDFVLFTGPTIYILLAGADTLGVNANAHGDFGINSGGCEPEGNKPMSTIPENFEDYYVIYTLCKGDTLSVPNPVRTIQCPGSPPPPGGGIVENFPFLRAPEWTSSTGDNFSVSFRLGTSELRLFPTETTMYEGVYATFSCGGAAGPLGFPIKYLVLVEDSQNCTSDGQPNFVIEACVGDIIELPSPNQVGQPEQYVCDENIILDGGSVAELVELNGTAMKVQIKEAGKFSINGMGRHIQTIYNRATVENPCPLISYQFEVKLKADCSTGGGNIALFDDYPWLTDLVNSNNCTAESVELYQTGIFFYLLVKEATGTETLYNGNGQFYCQNASNYDCLAAYNLGSPIDSWTCGGTPPPPPPPPPSEECGANTGTFFFRDCDDGQTFFFIQLEDGTIYDPYFSDDFTVFEVFDGQKVKFNYVDADFATPCSLAEKAIILTCAETISFPPNNGDCSKNSGEIVVTECDDGTEFFFIKSATDGLLYDAYFAEGIDFLKYHGQRVNFDFVLADFESPCSIADEAIIVNCIEESTTVAELELPAVFSRFEWLSTLVDPFDCEEEEESSISVYQQSVFNFIFVQTDGVGKLYFQDGTFYCQDAPNYDCLAAYSLAEPVDFWSCSGTGLAELSERTNELEASNNLKLFPNPVSTNLTVELPQTIQENQELKIFDTFGRTVLERTVGGDGNRLEVDVTNFQNGLYYLVLFGNGKEVVQKFIKQDLK